MTEVRLHQNESPFGTSQSALRAAGTALHASSRYPDSGSPGLCRALAAHYGVDTDMVTVGAGSAELILATCHAWSARGPVVTTRPGFPGYAMMARIAGAPVAEVPCAGYRIDVDALAGPLRDAGCAFVCDPLNPTGAVLRPDELRSLVRTAGASGAVLVVDEAYAEFSPDRRSAVDEVRAGGRAVVLRTFSKAYGLAGLRAGYAIGPAELIVQLRRWQPPFTVNRAAQAAAEAALGDQGFLRQVVAQVAGGRRRLEEGFGALGFGVVRGNANFVLVEVHGDSLALAEALGARSFLVQEMTAFGLPGHLRVTVGTPDQNEALLQVVGELVDRSPAVEAGAPPARRSGA